MRWNKPRYGNEKVVKKFLWFPQQIGFEVRWLEKVTILYRYTRETPGESYFWMPIEFLEYENKN